MEDSHPLLSPVEIVALRRSKSFSPLSSPPARVPLTREDSIDSPIFLKRRNDDLYSRTRPLPKRPASAPPAPEQKQQQQHSDQEEEERRGTGWKCINSSCDNTDRSLLSQNDQGDHVCDKCGVCNGRVFVGLVRQKNCARDDDKTVVAELDAEDEAPAYITGMETAAQARVRHLGKMPGSGGVSRRAQRRGKFEMAKDKVDTLMLKDARESGEIDTVLERKRRAVLKVVEACFDQIGRVDDRVRRHIRMSACSVLERGMAHVRCCNSAVCSVALDRRANGLIALAVVHLCYKRFLANPATGHTILNTIAPEGCTQAEVRRAIACVQALELDGAGSAQRAAVSSSVEIVMDWEEDQICVPCVGGGTSLALADVEKLPSPQTATSPDTPTSNGISSSFQLSMDIATAPGSPSSFSQVSTLSSAAGGTPSIVVRTRDTILAGARMAQVGGEVRSMAVATLQDPCVVEWMATSRLPVDVLGIVMLMAAAKRLELPDATGVLLQQICNANSISATSARTAASHVFDLVSAVPASSPSASAAASSAALF